MDKLQFLVLILYSTKLIILSNGVTLAIAEVSVMVRLVHFLNDPFRVFALTSFWMTHDHGHTSDTCGAEYSQESASPKNMH